MLVDLHLHTTRYSRCAKASPDEMMAAAAAAGLDGVVITEHHVTWGVDEIAALRRAHPRLRIFRGMEITTDRGRADILVLGVDRPEVLERDMRPHDAVRRIRAAGGTSVLAHPFRLASAIPAEFLAEPPDAYEVMSFNMLAYARRRAASLRDLLPTSHPLVASDAHNTDGLGAYAIEVDDAVADEADLAQVVRDGQFRAVTDYSRLRERYPHWQRMQERVRVLAAAGASFNQIRLETRFNHPLVQFVMGGGDLLEG